MKIKNMIVGFGLWGVAATILLAACSPDPMAYNTGQLPDAATLAAVSGTFRSSKSLRDRVPMHMVEGASNTATDKVYYRLNQAAPQAMTLTAKPDPSLVAAYNEKYGAKLLPLPVGNVTLTGAGKISVAQGERVSGMVDVTFKADGLEPGIYLMPVVIGEGDSQQAIYYGVTVRGIDKSVFDDGSGNEPVDCPLDTEWNTVFYVNTGEVQANYADYATLEKQDGNTFEVAGITTLGNMIVLRIALTDYDATTKRVLFAPTSDVKYTVEHADKYIRPMQDKGRKILVCIEGGGTGVGFCNMNDAQIADFAGQVSDFITAYGLDGVNLWDRGSGYDKGDAPEVNTTSYPKLIKALREAMPEKMITVVDYEEPTASFHDTALTGGIAVGDYIDYAWHGYVSVNKPIVFCDPYNSDTSYPQEYARQPFAGLDTSKYGNINVPFYSEQSDLYADMDLDLWMLNTIMWGIERSNNIIVFDDIPLPAPQFSDNGYLSMVQAVYMCLQYDADFNSPYNLSIRQRVEGILRFDGTYNYWAKNW